MYFRRISDYTIRCTITQEDMSQYDIQLDDLLENRDKADSFLHQILAEAKQKVDFQANEKALSIQLSVMPGGDVSMTISDHPVKDLKSIIEELGAGNQDVKETLEDIFEEELREGKGDLPVSAILEEKRRQLDERRKRAKESPSDAARDRLRQKPVASAEVDLNANPPSDADIALARAGEDILRQSQDRRALIAQLDRPLWAEFSNLQQLMRMIRYSGIPHELPSELYQRDGIFYLRLFFANQVDEVSSCLLGICEYADYMYAEEDGVMTFQEHASRVIEQGAVGQLARLL